jgi:hypothetical protein
MDLSIKLGITRKKGFFKGYSRTLWKNRFPNEIKVYSAPRKGFSKVLSIL